MTPSEAPSKRLKILILVYYYATDYILKARNKKPSSKLPYTDHDPCIDDLVI